MKKNKIYRFFTSVRLAVVLLSVIAALCVLCTLIPQNLAEADYIKRFGRGGAAFIVLLGFNHVLTSPLMYISGVLFGVNLTLCTFKRFYFAASGKGFRADRWGSPVLHVGLCLILAGAALSVALGKRLYYEVPIGETARIQGGRGGFGLRADDFKIEYYKDGVTPKQYKSRLTVKGEDGESFPAETAVNAPMKYKGVSVLQQDYGFEITATLRTPKGSREVKVKNQEWIPLAKEGGEALSLGIIFYPDYLQKEKGVEPKSCRDKNPRLVWILASGETPIGMDSLAPGAKGVVREPLSISFDSYRYYTGLQVKYDPGIPVIYGGFFMVCLGLLMRYAFADRGNALKRLWPSGKRRGFAEKTENKGGNT